MHGRVQGAFRLECAWAQIRGGGGGRGDVSPPPTFFQVGDTISNVPPPPPRFGGRMNFGRYNVVFCFFFYSFVGLGLFPFFFFFLLVRNVRDVGWVPLHILTCATFDADGAPEKKVRYLWGWRRSGKMCLPPPPPPIRFGFAPLRMWVEKSADYRKVNQLFIHSVRQSVSQSVSHSFIGA